MPAGLTDLQVVMKAKDEASKVMNSVGGAGAKAANTIRDNWKGATVALSAAAAGLEALNRGQQENTIAVGNLANQMGIQESEVRDLAKGLSNVTFPLEDVLALMKQGNDLGIESEEALTEYANFWDMVGDATGGAGPELAKAGIALKQVGLDVGDSSKALDAFGFITNETSMSVSDFLQFIERAGPELNELGLSVDQTAALIAAMENELGLAGKTARAEFRAAVAEAGGELEGTLEILGLSADALSKYEDAIADSSTVISENAAVLAESFSPLQKFQHEIGELVFGHADLIKQGAALAPIMLAIGPAAGIASGAMSVASGAAGIAAGAFSTMGVAARAAWIAATGPVGILLAAIAAVTVAIILIIKNWDSIKAAATTAINFVADLFNSKWGWLLPGGTLIKSILFLKDNWEAVWSGIADTTKAAMDIVTEVVKGGVNSVIGLFNALIRGWNALEFSFPGVSIPFAPDIPAFSVGVPKIPTIPSLEHGGIVPGPSGMPRLILAHGGEEFLGVGSSRGGGRVLQVVNHFHGDVIGVEDVEAFITTTIRDALRRGGFDQLGAPA